MPHTPGGEELQFQDDFLQTFQLLHNLLWGKHDVAANKVYSTVKVKIPNVEDEGTGASHQLVEVSQLSVEGIFAEYEEKHGESVFTDSDVLPCKAAYLLVRDAYVETLQMINGFEAQRTGATKRRRLEDGSYTYINTPERRQKAEKGYLICGQPGIGKTWFLTYLLTERLLLGLPTIFQIGSSSTTSCLQFLFTEEGVRRLTHSIVQEVKNDSRIWALVDQRPMGAVAEFSMMQWLVVIALSPKKENLKVVQKHHGLTQLYYMPVWSWHEIAATALLSGMHEENTRELYRLFKLYGAIPRLLLEKLFPPRPAHSEYIPRAISSYEQELSIKVNDMLRSGPHAFSTEQFGRNDSHTILVLQPTADEELRHISSSACLTLATRYIGWKIGCAGGERARVGGQVLYDWLLGTTEGRTAAGWVFEGRMHLILSSGGSFMARQLGQAKGRGRAISTQSSSTTWRIELKAGDHSFSSLSELGAMLRAKPGSSDFNICFLRKFLRPKMCILASIDGIAIITDPSGTNSQLQVIFFQVTISPSHPMKSAGLQDAWEALPAGLKGHPPIIVLTVPHEMAVAYKRQPITPTAIDHPAKQWCQYVVGVKNTQLWSVRFPYRKYQM